jgi:hypothetical protein
VGSKEIPHSRRVPLSRSVICSVLRHRKPLVVVGRAFFIDLVKLKHQRHLCYAGEATP